MSDDYKKTKNSIYNTLIGGNASWKTTSPMTGEPCKTSYDWHCLYDRLRITYDRNILIDGWRHHSLHWNNVNHGGIAWNFHWAFRTRFPFIKIGFNSLKNLYRD